VRLAAGLVAALALGAGGAAARLSPPSYALPSWSPDGQRLAFASASGAGSAVVTANAGGGPLRRLSRTGALSQVVWSPRGGRIAYGSRGRLYVIRSDGKQRHAVGSGAEAAWSPDGTKLAFASSAIGGPIERVDAAGGGRTVLTRGRFDHSPAWSPDGSRLAFSRATTVGGPETLFVVGADGTGLRSLGPQGASAAWSPDGRALAFWQRNPQGVTLGVFRFAGEQVTTLTRTFAAYSRAPRWSPDGTKLLITVCALFGTCRLDVAAVDGSGVRQVGPGSDPAWSPDGARIAFVQRRSCSGWSVFVTNAEGTGLRRITPCR
jgi:Tol biopolymer transport system component